MAAKWEQEIVGKPAELRIPLHGVDVEEHSAASVGDVRAVDPAVAAPCQALWGKFKSRHSAGLKKLRHQGLELSQSRDGRRPAPR